MYRPAVMADAGSLKVNAKDKALFSTSCNSCSRG